MREAFAQVAREPARQQAAQLPDDVRHPVGRHRRSSCCRRPARASSAATRPCSRSSAGTSRIVWGGRTTMQAGGERAGRRDLPDRRRRPGASSASRRWCAWSAPRSSAAACGSRARYNAAALDGARHRAAVPGDPHHRRRARPHASAVADEEQARRVAIIGADACGAAVRRRATASARRSSSTACRTRSSARSGRRTRTATTAGPTTTRCSCRSRRWRATSRAPTRRPARCRQIIVAPQPWVVGRPAEACSTRAPAASRTSTGRSSARSAASWRRRNGFDPEDRDAHQRVGHLAPDADVRPDDRHMKRLLQRRRPRHAGARRHRRDEHHAGRRARADARDRRAQGARRHDRRRSSGSSSSRASS